jgi:hypothetical protein
MAEAEQTLFGQAPPFTQRVMNTPLPGGVVAFQFLPPNLEKFDGFSDTTIHLENFNYHMSLLGVTSALKCRIFATTLKHHAIKWLFSLPLNPSMTLRIFPQSFWIDLL